MEEGQSLERFASRALEGISQVVKNIVPDAVIVQGDTTSATMAALAAFYQRVPVAHVEAGLRTHNIDAPFPEELNRQLIGRIARWHFVPTETAGANLLSEGVPGDRITVTGNTGIDALLQVASMSDISDDSLAAIGVPLKDAGERLVLVTTHRRENFGEAMAAICCSLSKLVSEHPSLRVVFPVHPNPSVKRVVENALREQPRIHLVPPLPYRTFVALLQRAWIVVTDSGGLQEEAPALGKPVLILRDVTERPEAIQAGSARLVGSDAHGLVEAVAELVQSPSVYERMAVPRFLFGDGHAAERAIATLAQSLACPLQSLRSGEA